MNPPTTGRHGFGDGRIGGMWAIEDTWTRMRQLAGDGIRPGELGALG